MFEFRKWLEKMHKRSYITIHLKKIDQILKDLMLNQTLILIFSKLSIVFYIT